VYLIEIHHLNHLGSPHLRGDKDSGLRSPYNRSTATGRNPLSTVRNQLTRKRKQLFGCIYPSPAIGSTVVHDGLQRNCRTLTYYVRRPRAGNARSRWHQPLATPHEPSPSTPQKTVLVRATATLQVRPSPQVFHDSLVLRVCYTL
jgi:hypothetical protein